MCKSLRSCPSQSSDFSFAKIAGLCELLSVPRRQLDGGILLCSLFSSIFLKSEISQLSGVLCVRLCCCFVSRCAHLSCCTELSKLLVCTNFNPTMVKSSKAKALFMALLCLFGGAHAQLGVGLSVGVGGGGGLSVGLGGDLQILSSTTIDTSGSVSSLM